MKKVIAIFLIIIYGFTSVGATIHFHYCMNKFVGASFFKHANDKCGKCGMEENKKKGCCKDVHHQIKIVKEHKQNESRYHFNLNNYFSSQSLIYCNYNTRFTYRKNLIFFNTPSHFNQQTPIYILNCLFRI